MEPRDREQEDEVLHAVREALLAGDERPFARWCAAERPRFEASARAIWGRWRLGPPHAAQLDDLVQVALYAALKAIRSYRWVCPRCTRPDARYGRVRCWSAASARELEAHAAVAHPPRTLEAAAEPARAAPHVSIARRAWYMAGVAVQTLARAEAVNLYRFALLEEESGEPARRTAFQRALAVRAVEGYRDAEDALDQRRRYAALPPSHRALASALEMGLDAPRALALCCLTEDEITQPRRTP